jgi:hypothetical protein
MIGLGGQNRTASKSFGDSCVAITPHREVARPPGIEPGIWA